MVCPEVWQCHHLGLDWRWSGLWLHPTDWQNVTRLKVRLQQLAWSARHTSLTAASSMGCDEEDTTQWVFSDDLLAELSMLQEPEGALHGILEDEFTDSWLIARNWDNAFLGALGPMPQTMHSPCCAEFMASRERIQARPKAFYVHIR